MNSKQRTCEPIQSGSCWRPGRLGVGVAGRAQHGDEQLGAADLAGGRIDDRHGVAAVVDEQLVPGAVHLAHGALQAVAKASDRASRTGCSGTPPGWAARTPPTAAAA